MVKKILRKIYINYLVKRYRFKGVMFSYSFLNDYEKCSSLTDIINTHKIHKKGFLVSDWNILGLNKSNYKKYLSNAQYYSMHPINKQYSKWIDDKLTLKYLCSGTKLDKYMPKYYAQIDQNGELYKLMDYSLNNERIEYGDIANLIIENGALAIKQISGSIGVGFYKAEYKENLYWLNDKSMDKQHFCKELSKLRNYLITEYYYPNKHFEKYCNDAVNCLRVLVAKIDGKLEFIKAYIRLGTKQSGFVENYNRGGVLCFVDINGFYKSGNIIKDNKNVIIEKHPDNNIDLSGEIPKWKEIKDAIKQFYNYYPQLKYLGFDFIISDKDEIKILEINSLTSLDTLQLDEPILTNGEFQKLYSKCL